MRVQTTFEKFAHATQGSFFAFCFVALRVVLGVSFVLAAQNVKGLDTAWAMDDSIWFDIVLGTTLLGCGVSFVLGLLVRPAALAAMTSFLIVVLGLINPVHGLGLLIIAGVMCLLGMFAAGGSGHAFGLDGIVLRNIRRPGRVGQFLFG